MKNNNKKILIIAVIMALITSFVGYKFLTDIKPSSTNVEEMKLIVAAEDIPPRTKIEPNMIKEIKVPSESYILDSIQDREKLIGSFTKEQILEGEIIPKQRLIQEDKKDLALRIPDGKRAISISVDEYSGVADLIKPGDNVDVFVTLEEYTIEDERIKIMYPKITKLLLQNLKVLAISQEMNRKDAHRIEIPNRYSITLAVTPDEAEKLVLSENMGVLTIALRPQGDNKLHQTSGTIREDLVPEKGKKVFSK